MARPRDDLDGLPGLIEQLRTVARAEAERRLGSSLGRVETPSDLAQSVIAELLGDAKNIDYRGDAAMRALIKTIVAHKIVEKARRHTALKRCRQREVSIEGDADEPAKALEPAAAGHTPPSHAELLETAEAVRARMASLDSREADVIRRRLDGQGHEEIAAALGISTANSQQILSRARRKLERAM